MRIASAFVRLGYTVLFPYMEEGQYDLVVEHDGEFERVQVKSSTYDDGAINFSCHCSQSAKGANSATHYTEDDIEGIAVYNRETNSCYWIPVDEINKWHMTLRESEDAKNPANEYLLEDAF